MDAGASGGIAAELLGKTVKENGTVAILTGQLGTQDHAEKLRGFAATLATLAPHLSLLPAIETHEIPRRPINPRSSYCAASRTRLASTSARPTVCPCCGRLRNES